MIEQLEALVAEHGITMVLGSLATACAEKADSLQTVDVDGWNKAAQYIADAQHDCAYLSI